MYKRLELHNHTTESDASLKPMDLILHMLEDKVDAFAITDHNTISGQKKLRKLIDDNGFDIGLIRGMELTTYYGHILCLNTTSYIEWDDIDINKPEVLFDRAHEKGGIAGIAHPYSYGAPFARGCRFDMKVSDYGKVDFIEISNDLEPLHQVNERGLNLWQELVLGGEKLAATAGMDLHGKWDMSDNFATFIQAEDGCDYEKELEKAIKTQMTWVSKGPILEITENKDAIACRIIFTDKPGYKEPEDGSYKIVITGTKGDIVRDIAKDDIAKEISIDRSKLAGSTFIPKLYRGEAIMENLVCVSPVIRSKFSFDTTISREALDSYLSRAVTAADLYLSDTLEDDLRIIKEQGIKFLGRASGIWYVIMDDDEHFEKSRILAEKVHEVDEEIILQACVFEAVFRELNDIKIPKYVFEAFGLPYEDRCFRLDDILFPEKPRSFTWEDGGIPDISRLETRMWFYYRATRYIDSGYEALHMGQIHLYTANDKGFRETYKLFDMIREYAVLHARRHKVILDAHTHGISVNGKLLFDYHAMPYTRVPLMDRDGDRLVLVKEGFSEGGLNPNGWSADTMPYLMEYDNWGGRMCDDLSQLSREERANLDWWGYDQIAWYAHQDKEARDKFLEYTLKWTVINNPNAYFEAPFCRRLSSARMTMKRADNGLEDVQTRYQINNPSAKCPMGFGQEQALSDIWKIDTDRLKELANPADLMDYGAKNIYDGKTGVKLPEKVVVYGSFQPLVGARAGDSNSEITRMYYIGDNTYSLSFIIPYRGEYDFAISLYGTMSCTYCYDTYPRSGSANKEKLVIDKDNTVVRITYRFPQNLINIEKY